MNPIKALKHKHWDVKPPAPIANSVVFSFGEEEVPPLRRAARAFLGWLARQVNEHAAEWFAVLVALAATVMTFAGRGP